MPEPSAICILGMHRSGTSLVARLLRECGLYLGDDAALMDATDANADGYWENERFVELNERVLSALGGAWDAPPPLRDGWEHSPAVAPLVAEARDLVAAFATRPSWGWKDPRNSLTLPFWERVLGAVVPVVCIRNPVEVALSLRRRDGFSLSLGLSLWAAYNERVLATTTPDRRIVVSYESCLAVPRDELARILARLGLSVDDVDVVEHAAALARSELHHQQLPEQALTRVGLSPVVLDLYAALGAEAGREPAPGRGRAGQRSSAGVGAVDRRAVEAEARRVELERAGAALQASEERGERLARENETLRRRTERSSARAVSRCSIVIPVFDQAMLTRQCLDALLADPQATIPREIVVVDDGSTDATPELLAGYGDAITVVTRAGNGGFAVACNEGAAAASGDAVVFLNNDTIPQAGWLEALAGYAERHPRAAAVGAKLVYPDGTVQHAGVVICQDGLPRHLYAGLPATHPAVNAPRRFQCVTAACMLVRRRAFEEVGGFEEQYVNGYEDVDLCLRFGERGYEIHYCPDAVLVHLESASPGRHAHMGENLQRYRARWAGKAIPDDIRYWSEDGFVRLEYPQWYPVRASLAPEVVAVSGEQERDADRQAAAHSRRVIKLHARNRRLALRTKELELALREATALRERAEQTAREHLERKVEADEQVRTLEAAKAAAEQQARELVEQRQQAQQQVGMLWELKVEAERQLEETWARSKSAEESLRLLSLRNAVAESELAALRGEAFALREQVEGLERRARRLGALRHDRRAASRRADMLESELAGARSVLAEHEAIVARRHELEAEVGGLRALLAEQERVEDDLAELLREREHAGTELELLRQALAAAETARSDERPRPALDDELRRGLVEAKAAVDRHDQAIAAELAASGGGAPAAATANGRMPVELYRDLVERVRSSICASTPEGSTVLVVSRGDGRLVELDGRRAWHFPRDDDGRWAGFYPETSAQAVDQLEQLHERGAEFIVFPSTALWWLDYYHEFAEHLESRYRPLLREPGTCAIFSLNRSGSHDDAGRNGQEAADGALQEPLRLLARRSEQVDALLDHAAVLRGRIRELEADLERLAPETLRRLELRAFLASRRRLQFPPPTANPLVSVVVPTYGRADLTFQMLESLRATTEEVPFELVIVDNASTDETRDLLARLDNVRVKLNDRNAGFGAACTLGAHLAEGRYVCFLNADTIVTPGWLEALVGRIETYPCCGAVGAKLVHPDGRLQEAGSMVWSDGSAWGYGRGADPLAPEYSYVREVDYCSAACLLVRREAFLDAGGFDERYAPAYYEDTDLCMALWSKGWKVVYEPHAVVVHVEFGGGGDPERAIALQLRNRERFVAKWREQLERQLPPADENCLAQRDRRSGPCVLVVDDRVPDSGQGSGFPRAGELLKALIELGCVVTFVPATDKAAHQPATHTLEASGIEVLHGPRDVEALLLARRGLYDLAVVSRPHNAPILNAVRRCCPETALVYDAEAVFAVRERLQAEVQGTPLTEAEFAAKLESEVALARTADLVLTVSERERRLIEDGCTAPVAVWGDSVVVDALPSGPRGREDLLFVGSLSTPPNTDAVEQLVRVLFPRIRERLACRLLVVGANPPPGLVGDVAALESVLFTGFVSDLAPLYRRARIFVAPHRFSAGAPHKVIEAMAAGIPCVVSELLGDQLEITDGVEALVARDADDFCDKVARLYRDRRLWRSVQRNAAAFVSDRYDSRKMRDHLQSLLELALEQHRDRASTPTVA